MVPWCQCSILRSIRPSSSWIEPVPKYVIEITFPCIEYLKSTAAVVESDEAKVICLPSFRCGFQINWPVQTHQAGVYMQRIEWNARIPEGPLFYRLSIGQVLA